MSGGSGAKRRPMSTGVEPTITLTERPGYWVAIDVESGVGAQGETREEALAELDDAVALHAGEGGVDVDDEPEVLRDLGIDPSEVQPTEVPPDFLR